MDKIYSILELLDGDNQQGWILPHQSCAQIFMAQSLWKKKWKEKRIKIKIKIRDSTHSREVHII
jgi:hypothetical protein